MSALNFVLQKDLAIVSTDTLALNSESHLPSNFQSKAYPVLHLDGVVCGTGISQFVARWYTVVVTSMLAKSVPHLDEFSPQALRNLAEEMALPDISTTTIYHFGYDQETDRYRGYAYRSSNNFDSEELAYGFGMKPQVEFNPSGNIIEDFIALISIQRDQELARPVLERIGIGGDIHILMLEPDAITIRRVHRFEDHNFLYEEMCSNLNPGRAS
jgi:hypothetical protein